MRATPLLQGAAKTPEKGRCCYTAQLGLCHKKTHVITQIPWNGEECVLLQNVTTARCAGACSSNTQPMPRVFGSRAEADAQKATASGGGSPPASSPAMGGKCQCCKPVDVQASPAPVEVQARCAGDKLVTVVLEVADFKECGCHDIPCSPSSPPPN